MRTCFSAETVDLNNQAPNRNKRESKYYWDEWYTWMAAAGFTSMEVPYEPKWDFGGRSGIPRSQRSVMVKWGSVDNYRKTLNAAGLDGISCVHLNPTLFCSGMLPMYLGAFEHFGQEAISFAKEAGAEAVSLTVTPPIYAVKGLAGVTEALFLEKTAEVIDRLAKNACEAGLKLCLKNEYWGLTRGRNILSFMERLENPVYLDVDTAHLQIAGVDVKTFIEENKARIGIVHFTDTSFVDDQEAYLQALPEFPAKAATKVFCDIGQGTVDFPGIYEALKAVGYDGMIVYNCKDSNDACRSLLRTRYYIDSTLSKESLGRGLRQQ